MKVFATFFSIILISAIAQNVHASDENVGLGQCNFYNSEFSKYSTPTGFDLSPSDIETIRLLREKGYNFVANKEDAQIEFETEGECVKDGSILHGENCYAYETTATLQVIDGGQSLQTKARKTVYFWAIFGGNHMYMELESRVNATAKLPSCDTFYKKINRM